ncbi:MAG: tetratricopeptide repeat protein [Bacteroidales bacterium]|nr:tetratricopeptide repeat protein [Bacteroidales bacterium]MDD6670018.1 tetratricopeptide repeat protein [Bacteroidales bacterium]
MMNLAEIKALIDDNRVDEAIEQLNAIIEKRPNDDALYFVRGNAFWKLGDRKHALDDYATATELNPDSPAAIAYKHALEIMDFFNKDMYNP